MLHDGGEESEIHLGKNFGCYYFVYEGVKLSLIVLNHSQFSVVHQPLALLFRNFEGFFVVVEDVFFTRDFCILQNGVVLS